MDLCQLFGCFIQRALLMLHVGPIKLGLNNWLQRQRNLFLPAFPDSKKNLKLTRRP
jgi:hypothetical protein